MCVLVFTYRFLQPSPCCPHIAQFFRLLFLFCFLSYQQRAAFHSIFISCMFPIMISLFALRKQEIRPDLSSLRWLEMNPSWYFLGQVIPIGVVLLDLTSLLPAVGAGAAGTDSAAGSVAWLSNLCLFIGWSSFWCSSTLSQYRPSITTSLCGWQKCRVCLSKWQIISKKNFCSNFCYNFSFTRRTLIIIYI